MTASTAPAVDPGDYWLNEWARWYRHDPIRLGYPHHVSVARGGGHRAEVGPTRHEIVSSALIAHAAGKSLRHIAAECGISPLVMER